MKERKPEVEGSASPANPGLVGMKLNREAGVKIKDKNKSRRKAGEKRHPPDVFSRSMPHGEAADETVSRA